MSEIKKLYNVRTNYNEDLICPNCKKQTKGAIGEFCDCKTKFMRKDKYYD